MWPFKTDSEFAVEETEAQVEDSKQASKPVDQKPPFPSSGPARTSRMETEEMEEYIRVSAAVGIDCCTDLTHERLLRCLREENIHIFNLTQVVNYLDAKLGDDWQWRGLRQSDAKRLAGWYTEKTKNERLVYFSDEPYRGAVPLPVLLTVQKILSVLPQEVSFYVSSPKHDDGDPFLCVTSEHLPMYVIERWNEPNFRER